MVLARLLAPLFLICIPAGLSINGPQFCETCSAGLSARVMMKADISLPLYITTSGQTTVRTLSIPDTALVRVKCMAPWIGMRSELVQLIEVVWYWPHPQLPSPSTSTYSTPVSSNKDVIQTTPVSTTTQESGFKTDLPTTSSDEVPSSTTDITTVTAPASTELPAETETESALSTTAPTEAPTAVTDETTTSYENPTTAHITADEDHSTSGLTSDNDPTTTESQTTTNVHSTTDALTTVQVIVTTDKMTTTNDDLVPDTQATSGNPAPTIATDTNPDDFMSDKAITSTANDPTSAEDVNDARNSLTDAPKISAHPTDAPKTDVPTFDAPTTYAPTTDASTTDAPTSDANATDAPTTYAAPTDASTTDAPTSDAHTTDDPTTEGPTTDAPTTDAPTTDSPKTDVPTTPARTTDASNTVAATTHYTTTNSLSTISQMIAGNAFEDGSQTTSHAFLTSEDYHTTLGDLSLPIEVVPSTKLPGTSNYDTNSKYVTETPNLKESLVPFSQEKSSASSLDAFVTSTLSNEIITSVEDLETTTYPSDDTEATITVFHEDEGIITTEVSHVSSISKRAVRLGSSFPNDNETSLFEGSNRYRSREKREIEPANRLIMYFKANEMSFYLFEIHLEFDVGPAVISDLKKNLFYSKHATGLKHFVTPLNNTYSCSSTEQILLGHKHEDFYLIVSELKISAFMRGCLQPKEWVCGSPLPQTNPTNNLGNTLAVVFGCLLGAAVVVGAVVHVVMKHRNSKSAAGTNATKSTSLEAPERLSA